MTSNEAINILLGPALQRGGARTGGSWPCAMVLLALSEPRYYHFDVGKLSGLDRRMKEAAVQIVRDAVMEETLPYMLIGEDDWKNLVANWIEMERAA